MVGAGIFASSGAGTDSWCSRLAPFSWMNYCPCCRLFIRQACARYPSAGGLIDWIVRGYGSGLFTGGVVMLAYFSTLIVTAMVTVSFGNYATSLFLGEGAPQIWVKIFAVGLVVLLTFVNSVGAEAAVKAQTAVVSIVLVSC
jgi:amino acid transporter